MRALLGFVVVACALAVVGALPARPPVPPSVALQKAALQELTRGVDNGRLDHGEAARYRADVNRAAALVRRLPPARKEPMLASLEQIVALSGKLTGPRAIAVFGQLRVTADYLARHKPPPSQTEVTDTDGVVYRYVTEAGFAFHPLASFTALNAAVTSGNGDAAARLAKALADRGVPQVGGGIAWEYYFPYGAGRVPWTSGMAQAVAAQAFARAAAIVPADEELFGVQARAAYQAIPGRLVQTLPAGPWIELYSFNRWLVLNAQLQSIVSLKAYARETGDTGAADFAERLQLAAAALLARFDTGYWTSYALPASPSSLGYQQYVTDLLKRLAPADPRFGAFAARIPEYERQPPAFQLADAGVGGVRFWLSKPATVRIAAAGRPKVLSLHAGWHTVRWELPKRPGAYPVSLTARDWAGNSASAEALPIVKVVPAKPKAPRAKERAKTGVLPSAAGDRFFVGAGVDDAAQARLAGRQGLGAVRVSVLWPAGSTTPDAATLKTLRSLHATGRRLVVELVAEPLPPDPAGLDALGAYAAALAERLPAMRDLLLGPSPAAASAPAYGDALATVYDAVKAARPDVAVAAELDGARSPGATLAAIGRALGASGRTAPLFDELAFRPAPVRAAGAWTLTEHERLKAALASSFAGTPQAVQASPILVDGLAVPTTIPAGKAGAYERPETPIEAASDAEQAAAYANALLTASCRGNVSGVIFRRLVDSPSPGEQSGVYYADGTPKTSAAATATAVATAVGGKWICPGIAVPVSASTLVFPERLSRSSATAVRLACTRSCLYLVTLDRPDGKPVLARRGSLPGRAGASAVRLPTTALPAGTYRLSVRLVSQVNPGQVLRVTSPTLRVS